MDEQARQIAAFEGSVDTLISLLTLNRAKAELRFATEGAAADLREAGYTATLISQQARALTPPPELITVRSHLEEAARDQEELFVAWLDGAPSDVEFYDSSYREQLRQIDKARERFRLATRRR